jgi:uroporphyrinogen decarboxylase
VDSRERTARSLHHAEPDRVPIDCWLSPSTARRIVSRAGGLDEFLDACDVDLRYIEGPRYVGPALPPDRDIWGVPRVTVTTADGEEHREVLASPLRDCRSPEEILDYPGWPSPDWFDYRVVGPQCEAVRHAGRVVVFMGDRLNRIAQLKPAMYLRGAEELFVDMLERPETAEALFGRISGFYLQYERRILESAAGGIDILCTGDDFGAQNGLLVSAGLWRRFLGPGFAAYLRLAREAGVSVMHHSCGSVRALVPDMLECGLDILQSLQPEAAGMDPAELKAEFGRRLCFQGGISIQQVLPRGSPQDVRAHVGRVFDALAPGGGYIAGTSHNIQADTPWENIRALFEAYRDLGRYPLDCRATGGRRSP